MINGVLSVLFIIGLMLLTLDTEYFTNSLMWSALIISISAGLMITLIVDKRALDAHNEVLESQKEIAKILQQLDETDQKHKDVLAQLKQSEIRRESLAKSSIIESLTYVKSMLDHLTSSLEKSKLEKSKLGKTELNLIIDVLNHLESSLNTIQQSIPQSSIEFKKHELDIKDVTNILRKLIMASISASDLEITEIFELIKKNNEKLGILLKQIS